MFTGIIRTCGSVQSNEPRGEGREITISGLLADWATGVGDSIAVQGICLTIEAIDGDRARFYASAETLARTTLADWAKGRAVHLEPALRAGDRLDGHMVQGHVDAVGWIQDRRPIGEDLRLRIAFPAELRGAIFPKVSVAVDGVSLTINTCDASSFEVNLIPHTRCQTLFDRLPDGTPVNLEGDPIAKQVAWLLRAHRDAEEVPT